MLEAVMAVFFAFALTASEAADGTKNALREVFPGGRLHCICLIAWRQGQKGGMLRISRQLEGDVYVPVSQGFSEAAGVVDVA